MQSKRKMLGQQPEEKHTKFFFRLTKEIAIMLINYKLTATEWAMIIYFVSLDPTGKYGAEFSIDEMKAVLGKEKSAIYKAKKKLENLGIFVFESVIKVRNTLGAFYRANSEQPDDATAEKEDNLIHMNRTQNDFKESYSEQESIEETQDIVPQANSGLTEIAEVQELAPVPKTQEIPPPILEKILEETQTEDIPDLTITAETLPQSAKVTDTYFGQARKKSDPFLWLPLGPWKTENNRIHDGFRLWVLSRLRDKARSCKFKVTEEALLLQVTEYIHVNVCRIDDLWQEYCNVQEGIIAERHPWLKEDGTFRAEMYDAVVKHSPGGFYCMPNSSDMNKVLILQHLDKSAASGRLEILEAYWNTAQKDIIEKEAKSNLSETPANYDDQDSLLKVRLERQNRLERQKTTFKSS